MFVHVQLLHEALDYAVDQSKIIDQGKVTVMQPDDGMKSWVVNENVYVLSFKKLVALA